MKSIIQFSTCILFLFLAGTMQAADLVVVQGGVFPQYATITAAIAAASNGDRILVTPGLAYTEGTMALNKNVQILSNVEGQQYQVLANITVTPPVASSNIVIQGMDLVSGYIFGGVVPGSVRSKFTMVGSKLQNGYVDFYTNTFWDLNLMQDSIMGTNAYVDLRFGKIIGNYINSGTGGAHSLYIYSETTTAANDTVFIVGNKIEMSSTSASQIGIYWYNSTNFCYIANNYVKVNVYAQNTLVVQTSNTNGSGGNAIVNNTFYSTSTGAWNVILYGINSYTFFYNNLLLNGGTGLYALYLAGPLTWWAISYNNIQVSGTYAMNGITNDGTNVTGSNATFDINTGMATGGSAINGGYPNDGFADHDLTRNDNGCGGGSLKITNFHPMSNLSNGARVAFVQSPRRVLQGNNVIIKGDSFDK